MIFLELPCDTHITTTVASMHRRHPSRVNTTLTNHVSHSSFFTNKTHHRTYKIHLMYSSLVFSSCR